MSGDVFRIEVAGKMRYTQMSFEDERGYHSVDGFELRTGLRAAVERY